MNDPQVLQPIVAKVAALIDERAPHEQFDRTWAVRSTPITAPAGEPGAA